MPIALALEAAHRQQAAQLRAVGAVIPAAIQGPWASEATGVTELEEAAATPGAAGPAWTVVGEGARAALMGLARPTRRATRVATAT